MNKQYKEYLKRVWSFSHEVADEIFCQIPKIDQDERTFNDLRQCIFERIAVPWRFYKGE